MTFLDAFAGHSRVALASLTVPATYRISFTYNVRVASAAAAGATSIGFTNVPAALAATAVGDTFLIGATTHTVTNVVTASGGALTGVTFTPALAASVPAGVQVVLNRATDYAVTIREQQVDGYEIKGGVYGGGDWVIEVFGLPEEVEPSGSGAHRIIWGGRSVTIQKAINRDFTPGPWRVRAL